MSCPRGEEHSPRGENRAKLQDQGISEPEAEMVKCRIVLLSAPTPCKQSCSLSMASAASPAISTASRGLSPGDAQLWLAQWLQQLRAFCSAGAVVWLPIP